MKPNKQFRRPKRFDYNVVVIGAGSAGLVSSYLASALKAKVALIEKHRMGGDCLNTGCVPSKALIRSAKVMALAQKAQSLGFHSIDVDFDFSQIMERVQRVIQKVEPHDSVERYTSLGVDCIQGEAKIISPYEVSVNGNILTTRAIIVATGARPLVPEIEGLDQVHYLTSDNLWKLRTLPPHLVILGGGPIGLELAQCFQRFGSKVTVVERGPRALGREDDDVANLVLDRLQKEGVQFHPHQVAEKVEVEEGRKFITLSSGQSTQRLEFDELLVAVGRRPNIEGFGLEELGVEIAERGTIKVDEFLCTNYPNVFVCGDVAGPYQFTHMAAHQAYYASVNALFRPFTYFLPSPIKKSFLKVNYSVVPWATYTDPEIATVGLTEKMAQEKKQNYELTTYGLDDLDRAIADEENYGLVKVLTAPGSDKILGATIVGAHASDMITEFISAMKHGFGLNAILSTTHIYPTHSEGNKYVAGVWKRKQKPEKALHWLEKFHTWRRGDSDQ